ncbi:MAG TPA: hypothetical protein VGG48_05350 [Rhizomicrobium sp.]|jgi:hypothetical protein
MNQQERTANAVKAGYRDPASLRQILIATTSIVNCAVAMAYFREHLDDAGLLEALIEIALEGEDAGDCPWAAANVVVEFPAELLRSHEASLRRLSQEQWSYLSEPAKRALAKIDASS